MGKSKWRHIINQPAQVHVTSSNIKQAVHNYRLRALRRRANEANQKSMMNEQSLISAMISATKMPNECPSCSRVYKNEIKEKIHRPTCDKLSIAAKK